jgi:xanthine permease XanP
MNAPMTASSARESGAFAWLRRLLSAPPGSPVRNKPATLTYGAEEWPPAAVIWISGVQHVGVVAIFLVYPLIIAREAQLSTDQTANLLQLGMVVLAIAVFLQALPRGPIGSRFLAPPGFTGIYLAPSMLALKSGGLPLVWGMTVFAGLVEMVLSRVWSRLRPFIPPESAGLVVLLIGAIVGLAACRLLIEGSTSGAVSVGDSGVVATALAIMVGLNIWTTGRLKLFCILIGMVAGYAAAAAFGLLTWNDLSVAFDRAAFAMPTASHISWAFDWELVVPFAVAGLAAAMNTTATITTYQRLSDAEWVKPDMKSISRGVLADGIATVCAGLFGTYGLVVASANVGLVAATGVSSRVIAFACAALLLAIAVQPTLVGLLAIMPRPVMASALLFTAAFIMIGGIQIISSRVLDSRRTLVVGMGLATFIIVSVYPSAFAGVPHWAQTIVTTPLVAATLVALALNLIFRMGIRRDVSMTFQSSRHSTADITNFIERCAGMWGARRDVMNRVEFAVQQSVEAIVDVCEIDGPIAVKMSYDEFVVGASIAYSGAALEFPQKPPTTEEIIESEAGHRRLAGFLIRRYADRVVSARNGTNNTILLRFDH